MYWISYNPKQMIRFSTLSLHILYVRASNFSLYIFHCIFIWAHWGHHKECPKLDRTAMEIVIILYPLRLYQFAIGRRMCFLLLWIFTPHAQCFLCRCSSLIRIGYTPSIRQVSAFLFVYYRILLHAIFIWYLFSLSGKECNKNLVASLNP